MRPFPRRAILVLLTALAGLAAAPLAQRLPLQRYSVEDGLPQSTVLRAIQDSRGYLWIGTQSGVCRFDGLTFTTYSRSDGCGETDVIALAEDARGNVWASTLQEGVFRFDGRSWTHADSAWGLDGRRNVRSICPLPDGGVWMAGPRFLCRVDGANCRQFSQADGLPAAFFTSVVPGPDGSVWLGTSGEGVFKFDGSRWSQCTGAQAPPGQFAIRLFRDRRGRIWAFFADAGIHVFENGRWADKNAGVPNLQLPVVDFSEDMDGRIIVGLPGAGVMVLSDKSVSFIDLSASGLPTDGLSCVLADREGNLWFGANNGLYRLSGSSVQIYDESGGLTNNTVWAVLQDRSGTFWFGCNQNTPVCYDGSRWKSPPGLPDGFRQAQVRCLMEDRRGRIWIGTTAGMAVYDPVRQQCQIPEESGLSVGLIYHFLEDREGAVWIATLGGVYRYSDGRFQLVPLPGPLQAPQSYTVFQDRGGDIWVGTAIGVVRFHGGKPRFMGRDDGIPANRVMGIAQDWDGAIWLGTYGGGLCRWDGSSMRVYDSKSGLSNNFCYYILQDGRHLYIGTNNGINRFDGARFSVLPVFGGSGSAESNLGAAYRDREGKLWFGTIGGAVRFDPSKEVNKGWLPPVYMTGVRLFGKSLDMRQEVELAYDQTFLTFEFVGLSFNHPRGVRYKYRVEELSQEWVETDQRSASVSYLPPGEYTFSVVARTAEGLTSAKPAQLKVRVRPPFWETVWFRSFLATFFVGLIVALRQFEVRRVRVRTAIQEEFRLAAHIQARLLPDSFPDLPGWDIHGRSVPALDVGGDYFDVIGVGDGTLALCVADVSGKGLPASLLMANLQAVIRGQVMAGASPVECVRRANRLIFESTRSERFVTLFFGVLDPESGELAYCNAGHNPPVLIRAGGGTEHLGEGGTILGVFEGAEFSMQSVVLGEGDTLVLYSDGITESNDTSGAEFGEERIVDLVSRRGSSSAADLERAILDEVERLMDPRFRPDDMTLLIVKRAPAGSPPV